MLLQALCGFYRRAMNDPSYPLVPFGYAQCNASAELVINGDGDLVEVNSLMLPKGKRQVPSQLIVPLPPKRTSKYPEPNFLYENLSFLFGLSDEKGKKEGSEEEKTPSEAQTPALDATDLLDESCAYRFRASQKKHETILKVCEDAGAEAVLRFFEKRIPGTSNWPGCDTSLLQSPRMFVVFRLQGDNCYLHERPAIREAWSRYYEKKNSSQPTAQCLVTGEYAPIAELHGNVAGFGQNKPTLVTFNQSAFCGWGNSRGANAPVSQRAAFEYVTALNLLCTDPRHYVNLSNTYKIVFWAEGNYPEYEKAVQELLAFRRTTDAAEDQTGENAEGINRSVTKRILNTLLTIQHGGCPSFDAGMPDVPFYLVGLSSNKTRLVVRFFECSSLSKILYRLADHYEQLEMVGMKNPWPDPTSLLLAGTVKYQIERIVPNQEANLVQSILYGYPYPQSLYQSVLDRVRAEHSISGLRAGIIKATINRNEHKEVLTVALNKTERDTAYVLGRLMAYCERIQYFALDNKPNASITDKYLNSAMCTPMYVFPAILNLNAKHLSTLSRKKPGLAVNLRKEIGEVLDLLNIYAEDGIPSSVFPETMSATDQGKFLVGYHHQTQEFFSRTKKKNENDHDGENSSLFPDNQL